MSLAREFGYSHLYVTYIPATEQWAVTSEDSRAFHFCHLWAWQFSNSLSLFILPRTYFFPCLGGLINTDIFGSCLLAFCFLAGIWERKRR